MIKKINIIVLIFLTIFLISSVSATELENKTITTESTQSKNIHVETGKFGADMKVTLTNDGPITMLLEK